MKKENLIKAAKNLAAQVLDPDDKKQQPDLEGSKEELEAFVVDAVKALEQDDDLEPNTVKVLTEMEIMPTWDGKEEKEEDVEEVPVEEKKKKEKKGKKEKKEEAPTEEKKEKKKNAPKKVEGVSQTGLIRKLLKNKKGKKAIIKSLMETFNQKEGWAINRMKLYEKAYGEMGENDSKLEK